MAGRAVRAGTFSLAGASRSATARVRRRVFAEPAGVGRKPDASGKRIERLCRKPFPRKKLLVAAVPVVAVAVVASAYATGGPMMMGPTHTISQSAFKGYYDGHFVTYLSTDISNKAEAGMMHINYSASIGKVKGLPEIYLVQGRSAKGQLAVFGSQPGEPDNSPLWDETLLTWKHGSKPVLITSDNQVNKLESPRNSPIDRYALIYDSCRASSASVPSPRVARASRYRRRL